MAPLVFVALWTRRAARAIAPGACALALAGVVVTDFVAPLPLLYAVPAAAALVALTAARGVRRARAIEGTLRLDLEVGALFVIAAMAAAERVDGSLDGRFFPLVYL